MLEVKAVAVGGGVGSRSMFRMHFCRKKNKTKQSTRFDHGGPWPWPCVFYIYSNGPPPSAVSCLFVMILRRKACFSTTRWGSRTFSRGRSSTRWRSGHSASRARTKKARPAPCGQSPFAFETQLRCCCCCCVCFSAGLLLCMCVCAVMQGWREERPLGGGWLGRFTTIEPGT